jgi:hypothetical protein
VTLLKFLPALAALTLIFGVVTILLMFRARAMRALAVKWGFQYIGPSAFRWGFPSLPKIKPPLPASFSLAWYPADEIRQVWNVIEGQQSGMSVLIFDSLIGKGRGTYCTFIACQTERNPFGVDTWSDRVIQSGGWRVLYRVPSLQILPWTMGIQRLDDYVNKLQVGSVCEPNC